MASIFSKILSSISSVDHSSRMSEAEEQAIKSKIQINDGKIQEFIQAIHNIESGKTRLNFLDNTVSIFKNNVIKLLEENDALRQQLLPVEVVAMRHLTEKKVSEKHASTATSSVMAKRDKEVVIDPNLLRGVGLIQEDDSEIDFVETRQSPATTLIRDESGKHGKDSQRRRIEVDNNKIDQLKEVSSSGVFSNQTSSVMTDEEKEKISELLIEIRQLQTKIWNIKLALDIDIDEFQPYYDANSDQDKALDHQTRSFKLECIRDNLKHQLDELNK